MVRRTFGGNRPPQSSSQIVPLTRSRQGARAAVRVERTIKEYDLSKEKLGRSRVAHRFSRSAAVLSVTPLSRSRALSPAPSYSAIGFACAAWLRLSRLRIRSNHVECCLSGLATCTGNPAATLQGVRAPCALCYRTLNVKGVTIPNLYVRGVVNQPDVKPAIFVYQA